MENNIVKAVSEGIEVYEAWEGAIGGIQYICLRLMRQRVQLLLL